MHTRSLSVYTFAHFAVDFACFYVLFSTLSAGVENLQQLAFWFLVYNTVAFGLQFIVGYICDMKRYVPAGLIGVVITIVGLAFAQQIYLAVVLIALGNAFFHVGGGIDSLLNAKGKMSRSGIFVSSGSWGVLLGTFAGKAEISILYPMFFLAVSGVLIYIFCSTSINLEKSEFSAASKKIIPAAAIGLICISVAIRAHTGFTIPMEWKTTTGLIILATGASFLGKFSGGFIADKFGARLTGVGALVLSLPLLAFFNSNIYLCILGIFLFNMTMPVTLCVLAEYLEGYEGLAFGLTTLSLLLGTFVTYVLAIGTAASKYVIICSIIVSALCILTVTKGRGKMKENKEAQNA
ncbi:MAG: hypothetical protein JXN65_03575 [Clostridia bacterium]|nr:hypothetical protein [Clostridia bacterium]